MSTCLSRWALLTGLAFALPPLGPTVAEAQADVPDAANLYPGRYAAVCTPAPIFGCVCATDSPGEALMFTELGSRADHHLKAGADSEYLRMISWLRTCESAVPQRSPPQLLTAAACGGLRSAPDCRIRRALLHLSYICAPPILRTALVTHDPVRSFGGYNSRHRKDLPCHSSAALS